MKLYAIAILVLYGMLATAPAVAADGKAIYDRICYKCHRSGIDGAPKTGKKEDWAQRLPAGTDALVQSVINGKGNMDPRANRPELTDEEIRAAVEYLTGLAQ